jgi:hypothetical protein
VTTSSDKPRGVRPLTWILLGLLVVAALAAWKSGLLLPAQDQSTARGGGSSSPPPATLRRAQPNRLRLGDAAAPGEIVIRPHAPVELDGLTRAQVFALRTREVQRHRPLVHEPYAPAAQVFGQIEDGRPWWGMEGEFCRGPGKRSIDGPSEEARFLLNPFLLLGLDEGKAFVDQPPTCFPVWPQPTRLSWSPHARRAVVRYDITRFIREKRMVNLLRQFTQLSLDNYNARDFGLGFVHADPARSQNVAPFPGGRLFVDAIPLHGYIHRGGSCGYPGGCNNASPYEPQLYFKLTGLPARIHCKLWRERPAALTDAAEVSFLIEMR